MSTWQIQPKSGPWLKSKGASHLPWGQTGGVGCTAEKIEPSLKVEPCYSEGKEIGLSTRGQESPVCFLGWGLVWQAVVLINQLPGCPWYQEWNFPFVHGVTEPWVLKLPSLGKPAEGKRWGSLELWRGCRHFLQACSWDKASKALNFTSQVSLWDLLPQPYNYEAVLHFLITP